LTNLIEPRYAEAMSVDEHMTPSLARAARAVLNWSMEDLAERSGVSPATVRDYENGRFKQRVRGMNRASRMALARAFVDAGIEFTGGDTPGLIIRRTELLDNPPPPRKPSTERPLGREKSKS
jgi:transcriptional regulator with XRE-family HTH domain